MSLRPIALSSDLSRLRNEGYDLDIRGGFLLVRNVPYVGADRTVQRGILISRLDLSGDVTNKPGDHVAYWTGEHPCHSDGGKIRAIENSSTPQVLCDGVSADHTFSAKADYRDYHHKMTSYIARITGEATKLDPDADARIFPAIPADECGGPFKYVDAASSRAGISAVNGKLAGQKVGIAGLGGTGSYVLDLVAKTEVAEIRLIDGDVFSQHNAFRAPGAPTLEELQARPRKAVRLSEIYSNMHNGIIVHDAFLSEHNLALLDGLDFVFVCIDQGAAKRIVVDRLTANGTPFVEVGLGVLLTDGQMGGIVRVTSSTPATRGIAERHISFADDAAANDYTTNIQIAELNALNAAMAVIQWKKMVGIYRDTGQAVYTGYAIAPGEIANEGAE
ncbi:ThiF family adenylyltransferase [Microvirga lotononidis]|uniref:Dinucleotide-utilizing enzyme possibly involved in molybdopterin or thiamin biosynthesis n=1 Tax=Microvirga lotononidis TaxID=864069 RepID=I4YX84_9HYPH|nr:ThiF family adenylyltransferase [Microvirga lotononidis]EIM28576.1 dinucleotide-utilizing enzyme possibly involved in molybdopterin or thiamin biosynthesis [Microvirga lotononidis]WQO30219.1 ThiF family adenylyltransferase [Microvirga lotononidis]